MPRWLRTPFAIVVEVAGAAGALIKLSQGVTVMAIALAIFWVLWCVVAMLAAQSAWRRARVYGGLAAMCFLLISVRLVQVAVVRQFASTHVAHYSCAETVSAASPGQERVMVDIWNFSSRPLRVEQAGGEYEGTANPSSTNRPLSYWEHFGNKEGLGGFPLGTALTVLRANDEGIMECVEHLEVVRPMAVWW